MTIAKVIRADGVVAVPSTNGRKLSDERLNQAGK